MNMILRAIALLSIALAVSCSSFGSGSTALSTAAAPAVTAAPVVVGPRLLIRCDDIGLNHSVNLALERVIASGLPFSASVLAVAPAFREAAAILRRHPEVSVGVHFAVNAEWRTFRWGPVAGAAEVPSLVDADGYFYGTEAATLAHAPELQDLRTELRAQIDRFRAARLRIDYVDFHMGTLANNPLYSALVSSLAAELGVPVSFGNGERYTGLREITPERTTAGTPWISILHIAENTPEMEALVDFNPNGTTHVGVNRGAELDALLSPGFAVAVRAAGVTLITYRQFAASLRN